jgi:hypothetical protein
MVFWTVFWPVSGPDVFVDDPVRAGWVVKDSRESWLLLER